MEKKIWGIICVVLNLILAILIISNFTNFLATFMLLFLLIIQFIFGVSSVGTFGLSFIIIGILPLLGWGFSIGVFFKESKWFKILGITMPLILFVLYILIKTLLAGFLSPY